MRHKPGDLYLYYKLKQAEPWDWGVPVTEPSWGDWAGQQWGNLKGLFGYGQQAAQGAAASAPNTGSLMQRLQKLNIPKVPTDLGANAQFGATAPNAGLWRARMQGMANQATPAAESAYTAANAMQQGLKPPSLLGRSTSALGSAAGYLGRSFLTGPVQEGLDSLSRKGVEHMTGGPVDEGAAGKMVERGIGLLAPALKTPAGLALSAAPAAGRLGGAALGNAWSKYAPSALGGEGQAAEFGPAAQGHEDITNQVKGIKDQGALEKAHKINAFSTSFGPGWNDGKTELRPVKPLRF